MVSVTVDTPDLESIKKKCTKAAKTALFKVASNYLTHLKQDGFMPFDYGTLQNQDTFLKENRTTIDIVSQNAYARRLYYHPEYNFQKVNNANAGAYWFEKELEYMGGEEELYRLFEQYLEV